MLRPHQTIEDLTPSEPADAFAVGAFDGDELIAVGLIGPEARPAELVGPAGEANAWRVRGMATQPEMRGRGAGTAVLGALLEHARSHGADRVWASVRVPARSLYERAGFVVVSDEFEPPHIGPHVFMSRDI